MIRTFLNARLGRRDEGIALVLVIGMGTILAILVVAAIGYAVSGIGFSRATQDTDGSLAAAYAGIEEYQSRLAADPGYWKYGNPASAYSRSTGSVVTAPPAANPAFGAGYRRHLGRRPGQSHRRRRRRSDMRSTTPPTRAPASSGFGRPAGLALSTRTLVANLKQQGFLDFLYFTDYEVRDPADSNANCVPAYEWAVTSRPSCTVLQFAQADVLNGAVHTNDTLLICGATFNGLVTTGRPSARSTVPRAHAVPRPSPSDDPKYSSVVGMPSTNSQLKSEMRTDLATRPETGVPVHRSNDHPLPQLRPDDGALAVDQGHQCRGDPATSGTNNATCGTPGTGGLGSALGVTVPVPTNNVSTCRTSHLLRPTPTTRRARLPASAPPARTRSA